MEGRSSMRRSRWNLERSTPAARPDEHAIRRAVCIQLLDQPGAVLQDRLLIDRSFIGDLACVDRRRLVEYDRALDDRRAPGTAACQLVEHRLEPRPYGRMPDEGGRRRGGVDVATQIAAQREVGKDQ